MLPFRNITRVVFAPQICDSAFNKFSVFSEEGSCFFRRDSSLAICTLVFDSYFVFRRFFHYTFLFKVSTTFRTYQCTHSVFLFGTRIRNTIEIGYCVVSTELDSIASCCETVCAAASSRRGEWREISGAYSRSLSVALTPF